MAQQGVPDPQQLANVGAAGSGWATDVPSSASGIPLASMADAGQNTAAHTATQQQQQHQQHVTQHQHSHVAVHGWQQPQASDGLPLASPRLMQLQQQKPTVADIVMHLQAAKQQGARGHHTGHSKSPSGHHRHHHHRRHHHQQHDSSDPPSPSAQPASSRSGAQLQPAAGADGWGAADEAVEQSSTQANRSGTAGSEQQQQQQHQGYVPGGAKAPGFLEEATSDVICTIAGQQQQQQHQSSGGLGKGSVRWGGVQTAAKGTPGEQKQQHRSLRGSGSGSDADGEAEEEEDPRQLDIDFLSTRVHDAPPPQRFASLNLPRSQSTTSSSAWTEGRPAGDASLRERRGPLAVILWNVFVFLKALVWDVLRPNDTIRVAWDILMLTILGYVCIVLPFSVAFNVTMDDLTDPLSVFDLFVNCLFLWDVWMNFHTAYLNEEGKPITSRRSIALNYLRGWFWLDVISSIPFDLLVASDYRLVALLKATRLVRLLKVIRLIKLVRMSRVLRLSEAIRKLEDVAGRATLRMISFLSAVLLLLHWAACLFYFVADSEEQDGGTTWIEKAGIENEPLMARYVTALYWSVTTMATVGYGDVVALTLKEKGVAMVAMMLGATMFGYFMGAMASLISALNSGSARMAQKRQAVDDFLRHRRVPKALANKVRNYYGYVVAREVQADEADIIAGLSSSLRTQVVLHLYQEAVEKVPFFRYKPTQFITSVVTYLKLEYYAPGDIVMRQGDIASEMYFIAEGTLEVRLYEDDTGKPLANTSYSRAPSASTTRRRMSSVVKGALADTSSKGGRGTADKDASSSIGGPDGVDGAGSGKGDGGWALQAGWEGQGEAEEGEEGGKGKGRRRKKWKFVDDLEERSYRSIGFLHAGEYFSEYSCLLGEARTATVAATTYCELYSLSRSDLEAVLEQWPEVAAEFKSIALMARGGTPSFRRTADQAHQQQQQRASSTSTRRGSGSTAGSASGRMGSSDKGATAAAAAAAAALSLTQQKLEAAALAAFGGPQEDPPGSGGGAAVGVGGDVHGVPPPSAPSSRVPNLWQKAARLAASHSQQQAQLPAGQQVQQQAKGQTTDWRLPTAAAATAYNLNVEATAGCGTRAAAAVWDPEDAAEQQSLYEAGPAEDEPAAGGSGVLPPPLAGPAAAAGAGDLRQQKARSRGNMWLPGQGTGIFEPANTRYLFPGRLDRNGALQLGSPPAPTSAPAGGAPEVPLSRSSRAGSEGLGRTSAVSDSLARTSRGSGLGEGPLSRSSRGPEEGLSRTSWHPEREPSAS